MSSKRAFLVSHRGVPRLNFTSKDVDDLKRKLSKLGYACTVLKDPTFSTWRAKFHQFVASLRGCEIGVFHFSGHGGVGGTERHHHLYLGAMEPAIDYETDVMAYLTRQAPYMVHVHFLDCCRAGGDRLDTGYHNGGARLSHLERAESMARLEQGFARLHAGDNDCHDDRSYGIGYAAGPQQSKAVAVQFVTVFGCDPGSSSAEAFDLQNGILTAGVLKLLDEPMLEMSAFVKRLGRFVSSTADNQVPWVQANAQDDIYLNDGQQYAVEVHKGISCDICSVVPIVGTRYKSRRLRNYDVCEDCITSVQSGGGRPYDVVEATDEAAVPGAEVHDSVSCDICGMLPIVGTRYQSRRLRNYDVCEGCIGSLPALAARPYDVVEAAVAAAAAGAEVHHSVTCNICGMLPIVGTRYKSRRLRNYDVCEDCITSVQSGGGRPYDVIEAADEAAAPARVFEFTVGSIASESGMARFPVEWTLFLAPDRARDAPLVASIQARTYGDATVTLPWVGSRRRFEMRGRGSEPFAVVYHITFATGKVVEGRHSLAAAFRQMHRSHVQRCAVEAA